MLALTFPGRLRRQPGEVGWVTTRRQQLLWSSSDANAHLADEETEAPSRRRSLKVVTVGGRSRSGLGAVGTAASGAPSCSSAEPPPRHYFRAGGGLRGSQGHQGQGLPHPPGHTAHVH